MKGFAVPPIMWVVAALVILVAAGSNLLGVANLVGSITGETYVQGCAAKEGMMMIPLIGYYKCEITGENCDHVELPPLGFLQLPYQYDVCCDVMSTACTMDLMENDRVVSSATVNRGECMQAYVFTSETGIFPNRWVNRCYHPYTLYSYSPSGGRSQVYSGTQYSCTIPSDATQLLSGCLSFFQGQCSSGSVTSRTLDFDQNTNYFDKWVFGPMEYNLANHPTYGQVYCSGDGYLHKVTTVKLTSGCYAIPDMNSALPKADCCPNAISGNCVCNSNFKFDCAEPPQCSILSPCPGSNYYVPDYSDASRKTAVRYACLSGKCVVQKVTSACTSNEACPTGSICYLDPDTGIGVCQTSGTTPVVPREPGVVPVPGQDGLSWLDWLKMFSVSFILSLVSLGFLVYKAPIPFFKMLREPRIFLIALVVMSIVIMSIFAIPVQLITGAIYG